MIKVIDNRKKVETEWFSDLNIGDTFLCAEQLYIKCNDDEALNLAAGGEFEKVNIDIQVIPVDVEIKIIRKVEF